MCLHENECERHTTLCQQMHNQGGYEPSCFVKIFKATERPTPLGQTEFDLLGDELRNVLPENIVDRFAEYWCEPDRCKRDENLGGFIQRVAQYAIDHCK